MNPIRVLLADDHPVVRNGIRMLLEQDEEIVIAGEASSGEEIMRLVDAVSADVVLLDLELPDIPGIQVAHHIQLQHPEVKILALSAHDDKAYIKGVLESGAVGYLIKDEDPRMILEAVRGVARGEKGWVSRKVSAKMAAWFQDSESAEIKLSVREEEVLRLVVEGKTNQAIAAQLSISEKTVEKYLAAIFSKLNVTSRVEAAVYAVREGLVKPE